MAAPPDPMTRETLGQGVLDPSSFQAFSAEAAKIVRMYGDDDVSVVVWNLEPGQENPPHEHPENAHTLMVLQGNGHYVRTDGSEVPITQGDCIIVPRACLHGIRNTGGARLSYLAVTTLGGKGYVRNVAAGQH